MKYKVDEKKLARQAGQWEVVAWGNEPCTEHMEGYFRRECTQCWKSKLKERGIDGDN